MAEKSNESAVAEGDQGQVEGQEKVTRSRKTSEEVPTDPSKSRSRRSSVRGWTPKTFENAEPVDLKALLRNKSLLKSNPKPFSVRDNLIDDDASTTRCLHSVSTNQRRDGFGINALLRVNSEIRTLIDFPSSCMPLSTEPIKF